MIYSELTSPEIGRIAPDTIAVLPTASIEQHGDHLPVNTDTAIGTELGRRVEAALPDKVALLPTLWCGSSHHHLTFPGLISLRSETFINVLEDILDCLIKSGFKRVFILNAHGGNQIPFSEALYRVHLKHRGENEPWIAAASHWGIAAEELKNQKFMETSSLSHACEYETSMMLAIRTDWVRKDLSRGGSTSGTSEFYHPELPGTSKVVVHESLDQFSTNGALGSPELATVEKGQKLYELTTSVIVKFLLEFSKWERRPEGKNFNK
ncbi:MAG: creatininase family protein [Chthoniobacterales bacterium]